MPRLHRKTAARQILKQIAVVIKITVIMTKKTVNLRVMTIAARSA